MNDILMQSSKNDFQNRRPKKSQNHGNATNEHTEGQPDKLNALARTACGGGFFWPKTAVSAVQAAAKSQAGRV